MKGLKNTQVSYNNKKKAKKSPYILSNFITLHSTIALTPFKACNPQVVGCLCLSDPVSGKERSLCFKSDRHPLSQCVFKPLEHSDGRGSSVYLLLSLFNKETDLAF